MDDNKVTYIVEINRRVVTQWRNGCNLHQRIVVSTFHRFTLTVPVTHKHIVINHSTVGGTVNTVQPVLDNHPLWATSSRKKNLNLFFNIHSILDLYGRGTDQNRCYCTLHNTNVLVVRKYDHLPKLMLKTHGKLHAAIAPVIYNDLKDTIFPPNTAPSLTIVPLFLASRNILSQTQILHFTHLNNTFWPMRLWTLT